MNSLFQKRLWVGRQISLEIHANSNELIRFHFNLKRGEKLTFSDLFSGKEEH